MSKYHIKADGSIGICNAKSGKCPYTTHIMADTIEQAQIEADAAAYKNQQEELKRKFGDNVPTMDALLDSDGVGKLAREQMLSSDELESQIKKDIDELETMLKSDIPELNKSLDINNYKQKG